MGRGLDRGEGWGVQEQPRGGEYEGEKECTPIHTIFVSVILPHPFPALILF